MERKKVIIILLLLIGGIAIIGGILAFNPNSIEVNGTYFTLPEGYRCTANDTYTIITNDTDTLYINCYNTDDIKNITDSYVDYHKTKNNISVNISKTKFNNNEVYKSTMADPHIIHYWFVYNDKVYQIYSQTATSTTDANILSLIQSAKGTFLL